MHGCKAGWPCALLQHVRRPFHAKGAVGRALANLAACVCGACYCGRRRRTRCCSPGAPILIALGRVHCADGVATAHACAPAAPVRCRSAIGSFDRSMNDFSDFHRFPNWNGYLAAQHVLINTVPDDESTRRESPGLGNQYSMHNGDVEHSIFERHDDFGCESIVQTTPRSARRGRRSRTVTHM